MSFRSVGAKPVANETGVLSSEHYLAQWADLIDATDQFLLAGLRRDVGPLGDVRSAYRRWYAEQMEEHDRAVRTMLQELDRREGRHGR